TIQAPAKLNLRLKVTGRRADGYHELVTLMVPVDLCDLLETRVVSSPGLSLTCQGYEIPADDTNLVMRAARAFLTRSGIRMGLQMKLSKRIPVAAGLGGGSSDAAAVLLWLNDFCGRPLSAEDLHDVGTGLGADVPFFLEGRPALARGIGEILEPLEGWPRHWYVIVSPPIRISTAWVYGKYRLKELTRDEYHYIKNMLKTVPLAVAHILENDLEAVTSASFPIIETIKRHLIESGAAGALMSGSGAGVFGIYDSLEKAAFARQHVISHNLGDVFMVADWERPKP
ncbi:MAG: 4-(cytidine 5'-diphospho)-2-C-methyl-D-erythritol kinase, partial [Deltaproteobacteria bacterium]|nr:4-(cytidine 5'-diphospho)-2-C-methyl-D-erythritol kinase [Deltaproteobacteria bacterium]